MDDTAYGDGKLHSIESSSRSKNSILDELEKTATDLLDDFTQVTMSYNNLSPKKLPVKGISPNKNENGKLSPKKKSGSSVSSSSENESRTKTARSSKSEMKPIKQDENIKASGKLKINIRASRRKEAKHKLDENDNKKTMFNMESQNCSDLSEKTKTHSKSTKESKTERETSSVKKQSRGKSHSKVRSTDSESPVAPCKKTESKPNEQKKRRMKVIQEEFSQGKPSASGNFKTKQEERKKNKNQKPPLVFKVDCDQPASDGILDVSDFKQFLCERFKVNGRVKNLNDVVNITAQGNAITITSFDYNYSKRYLKYLTKKYLKKRGLRDWLRVIAPAGSDGCSSYQLRYYAIYCKDYESSDGDSD